MLPLLKLYMGLDQEKASELLYSSGCASAVLSGPAGGILVGQWAELAVYLGQLGRHAWDTGLRKGKRKQRPRGKR